MEVEMRRLGRVDLAPGANRTARSLILPHGMAGGSGAPDQAAMSRVRFFLQKSFADYANGEKEVG